MEVTAVRLTLMEDKGNLKGVGSIALDGQFAVRGMRVMERTDGGVFVTFPSRQCANGEYKDIAYPLNHDLYRKITDAVINEYNHMLDIAAIEAAGVSQAMDDGICEDPFADQGQAQAQTQSMSKPAEKPAVGPTTAVKEEKPFDTPSEGAGGQDAEKKADQPAEDAPAEGASEESAKPRKGHKK